MASPPTPGAGADPSMDDILASIRKILNEDDAAPPPQATPPAAEATAEAADDAMDLTADMMIAPPAETAAPAAAPHLVEVPPEAAPPAAPTPPPAPAPSPAPALAAATLVSPPAAAAAAAALGQLSRAVAQDRAASISRSMGLSIEDVVREELRPLLKEWLDTHLPPLVERLVRAEIERVMSRAG